MGGKHGVRRSAVRTDLPKVAIVSPFLNTAGGIPSVAAFIYHTVQNSRRYTADYISLACSAFDRASVRLASPKSWLGGVKVVPGMCGERPLRHVGAFLTEFEFQRYLPRRRLTDLLNRYDIIQIVAGSPAIGLVAKGVRRPVVLQVASLAAVERRMRLAEETGLFGLWFRTMTRVVGHLDGLALKSVDKVLVENRWMYDFVRQKIGPSRVVFAPPGIDTNLYVPAESADHGPAYILSVGRFDDPRKNVELLFGAYYQLRKIYPDPPGLVLAGQSGPSRSAWNAARSLGILPFVDYRPKPDQRELISLYRNASLFVLSSDEEGLGLGILEAMACGAPIVSTRCGGPETSVVDGENGFLTPRNDKLALADRMHDLIRNPDLRRAFGRKSRQIAEKSFSMSQAGGRFLDVYDELLRSGRTRGAGWARQAV